MFFPSVAEIAYNITSTMVKIEPSGLLGWDDG